MVVGFFETRPEVRAFVAELLDDAPAARIQEAVRERFGAGNVPSKNLLCRMRMQAANPRKILFRKQAGMSAPQAEGTAGRNACPTRDTSHQADAKTKQNPPVSPLAKVEKSIAGRNACSTKGNGNGLKREFITDKLRAIPGLPADISARLNADFIGCCQLPGIIRISNNSCLSRQVGDHIYDLDLKTCRGCPMLLDEEIRMMIRAALKARLQRNPIKKQAGMPAPQEEGKAGRNACPTKQNHPHPDPLPGREREQEREIPLGDRRRNTVGTEEVSAVG